MSSIDDERKRIYKGVYLDLVEDLRSDNAIARAADKAAVSVDAETIALYRKYNMMDKLPRRLQGAPADAWGSYNGSGHRKAERPVSSEKSERDRQLVMEWSKRLAPYR